MCPTSLARAHLFYPYPSRANPQISCHLSSRANPQVTHHSSSRANPQITRHSSSRANLQITRHSSSRAQSRDLFYNSIQFPVYEQQNSDFNSIVFILRILHRRLRTAPGLGSTHRSHRVRCQLRAHRRSDKLHPDRSQPRFRICLEFCSRHKGDRCL